MNIDQNIYDIFIVGGGINGCGIARDAAGRGYKVFLAEKNDIASGTSSGSTKLIHGGLRYLENYKFNFVRKSLIEREVLWKNSPHIIWPLRFVLPYHNDLRPAWFMRLGLFIYDYIGGRKTLPPTKVIDLKDDITGDALHKHFIKAFEYSDCGVDDARLVILNAVDAVNLGADINTRAIVNKTEQINDVWHIHINDNAYPDNTGGITRIIKSKILINATGPWIDQLLNKISSHRYENNIRLIQGSHIVVKKLYDHDKCYIFQNSDGRIIFAIPYNHNFTMIGTTDNDYFGDPDHVEISEDEIDYLCSTASEYFKKPIIANDIIWKFSKLRPIYNDSDGAAQKATRDYILRMDKKNKGSCLINIFGGKLTTYRKLSEAILVMVESVLGPKKGAWTKNAHLPGGDFPVNGFDQLVAASIIKYPFLTKLFATRLVRAYGTIIYDILGDANEITDMGIFFTNDLYQREVDYLIKHEFALGAEDILYRRSKLGLSFTIDNIEKLENYIARKINHADALNMM